MRDCLPASITPEHIELGDGALQYQRNFVVEPETLFTTLLTEIDWQQPTLTLFGRQVKTPRLVAFVGDAGVRYRYSGHTHCASAWPQALAAMAAQLKNQFDLRFNCALLNYYRSGDDRMGFHSDDEPELGPDPVLASVSLGEQRDFVLRRRSAPQQRHVLALENGSLLVMQPPLQRYWQHALPKRRRQPRPRINITFRQVLTGLG